MSSRDEILMQLIATTDMEFDDAMAALESSNWNLQACVDAHFRGKQQQQQPVRRSGSSSAPQRPSFSNDGDDGDDGVRAPMLPRSEVLVSDPYAAGLAGLAPRPHAALTAAHFQSNAFDASAAQRDFRAEGRFHSATKPNPVASQKLSELFRAPSELMFIGSFEEAMARAASTKKWLVVNVQDVHEFDSQRLNRDTWKHPGVVAMVQASCIFLQLPQAHPDTRRFLALYPAKGTVSVSVIDPRTGERPLMWNKFVAADEFTQQLADLMDRQPLDRFVNRRPAASMTASFTNAVSVLSSDDGSAADTELVNVETGRELNDDEMLAAAIAASLAESQKSASSSSLAAIATTTTTTGKRKAVDEPKSVPDADAGDDPVLPVAKTPSVAFAPIPLQSESDANAAECVLMVRLLNGGRLKCGFPASSTLADLHRYVSQHGFDGAGADDVREFSLTLQFPTRVFSGEQLARTTLKDANLVGRNQVMVTAFSGEDK
jgi:hypothetical protein